jgi:sodium-coupled neutral amino acid transporter 11
MEYGFWIRIYILLLCKCCVITPGFVCICFLFPKYTKYFLFVVGAGIIGLPFALKQSGFVTGIILTALIAFLTNVSLILMVYAGTMIGTMTFAALAESAMGKVGFWAVNLAVLVNGIGTMVSYLIIIGDTIPPIANAYLSVPILGNRLFVISVTSACFVCLS